jgi:hypothetical protein
MKRVAALVALAAAVALPASASAQAFNNGLIGTCTGNCGTIGANGNIGLSGLAGSTAHGYVSSAGNAVNAAANNIGFNLGASLPPGQTGETNGSKLTYNFNIANPNTSLSFKFQYISSDGTSSFIEYGYARLRDLVNNSSIILFHARTTPTGNIVPGFGLPPIAATISPATTPVIAGQTTWSPLEGNSGQCYNPNNLPNNGSGCGRTGWIDASYNVAAAGQYQLEFGVINWGDTLFDAGMAFDFAIGQGGTPVIDPNPVPEPMTVSLLVAGLAGLGVAARRRRNA